MFTQAALVDSSSSDALLLALELSAASWRMVFCSYRSGVRRRVAIPAWDVAGFQEQLEKAKRRLDLGPDVLLVCCQEAGRDGFSVHRYLAGLGFTSLVIDPASIAVSRQRRRAKTDRLDAEALMDNLLRHVRGERGGWKVVVVPPLDAEQARHLYRELEVLKTDATRIINRMRALLATVGIRITSRRQLRDLDALRCWDGAEVPAPLRQRLDLEQARFALIQEQTKLLEKTRKKLVEAAAKPPVRAVERLMRLRGIGWETAWCLVTECFAFRNFTNRRQVGSCAGLTPTPFDSGQSRQEQGIAKAGNRRIRSVIVETAWMWLRLQPDSALTLWFQQRFGHNGRSRRVGIVALARKLLIALWRYLEQAIVPTGATLKPTH